MHHPLHELADGTSARRLLADHADLVLRGHLHQTEVVECIDPDRRLRDRGSLYNSLYRESKEGRIIWTFGVPAVLKKPNPFSPWTPRPRRRARRRSRR